MKMKNDDRDKDERETNPREVALLLRNGVAIKKYTVISFQPSSCLTGMITGVHELKVKDFVSP